MKKYKAIFIDVKAKTCTDVELPDEDFEDLHKLIGTDSLDHTPGVPYFDCVLIAWVDDTGMYKPELETVYVPGLYYQPLAGNVVIWAAKGEATVDIPFTARSIVDSLVFTGPVSKVYPDGPTPMSTVNL